MSSAGRATAALALVLAAGCATPASVRFAGSGAITLPPLPGPSEREYHNVLARWARHAHVFRDYDTAMDVRATLLGPEMRAARAARFARLRGLTENARAELLEVQRSDDARWIEVVLVVHAARWEWNDLAATRTLWTLTLSDDRGRSAAAAEVILQTAKPEEVDALQSGVNPFSRAFLVRFRRAGGPGVAGEPIDVGDGTRWVRLRIAGALGDTGDRLRWDAE